MSLLARLRTAAARHRATPLPTMFGTARVYEIPWPDGRIRVLDVDGSYQSATYLDERWCDPPFPYLRRFDHLFEANPHARDLCMLGGGGYAYPRHVVAHHAPARIDVVEVDPRITAIAEEQFFLGRLREEYRTSQTGRLGLVCADARSHLAECAASGRRYDAVLNDCFAAQSPDEGLGTPEAIRLVRRCLNPQGLYLANVVAALEGNGARPLMELVATLGTEFEHVDVLPTERRDSRQANNVLVVAQG